MKKYLSVIFLISFFLFSQNAHATGIGSFQLLNFPASITKIVGQQSSVYINFLYSGQASQVGVSFVGDTLPDGMQLGYVSYGAYGVDGIEWSGIPTTVGDYPLTLVLTDNNGVILSQPLDFKVVSNTNLVTFTTNSLPNAVLNQNYSTVIKYTYLGTDYPYISFGNFPQGLDSGRPVAVNGIGTIALTGTIAKAGIFTFSVNAQIDGVNTGAETFSLVVDDPNKPSPPPVVVTPAPVITPQVPVVVPQSTPTPTPTVKIIKTSKTKINPVISVKSTIPAPVLQPTIPQPTSPVVPTATPQKESFFRKIKDFFSNLF